MTSANYAAVANEATAASSDTVGLSDMGSIVTGADARVLGGWATWGLQRFAELQARPLPAATVAAAVQSDVLACGAGTMTLTSNDADNNNAVSAGDLLTLDFRNCTLDGDTLNGRTTITVNTTPTGTLGSFVYAVDLTMAFENLVAVSSSVTSTASGSLRLAGTRSAYRTGVDTVTASGFSSAATVAGVQRSRTLSSFTTTLQYLPAEVTVSFGGTVVSSVLAGQSVVVGTPVPFRQRYTDAYPYAGVLKATGASGGAATLTTVDAASVTVSLDANGDGTAEQSTSLAWSSIL